MPAKVQPPPPPPLDPDSERGDRGRARRCRPSAVRRPPPSSALRTLTGRSFPATPRRDAHARLGKTLRTQQDAPGYVRAGPVHLKSAGARRGEIKRCGARYGVGDAGESLGRYRSRQSGLGRERACPYVYTSVVLCNGIYGEFSEPPSSSAWETDRANRLRCAPRLRRDEGWDAACLAGACVVGRGGHGCVRASACRGPVVLRRRPPHSMCCLQCAPENPPSLAHLAPDRARIVLYECSRHWLPRHTSDALPHAHF